MDTIHLNQNFDRMIAHRGCSVLEQENTNAAFVAAGNRSYYGIETDVHLTKDNQFIIIHDENPERVSGVSTIVEESNFDDLRKIALKDLDGSFSRGDLMMPSLREYILICKKYEKKAVLEIKNPMPKEAIARIIDIVRDEGWLSETIFISFALENLVMLREILPEQPAQYLVENVFADDLIPTLLKYKLDLDIDMVLLTRERVEELHRHGILVNCWTVDTLEDAQRVLDFGVDFITSDALE